MQDPYVRLQGLPCCRNFHIHVLEVHAQPQSLRTRYEVCLTEILAGNRLFTGSTGSILRIRLHVKSSASGSLPLCCYENHELQRAAICHLGRCQ